MVLGFTTVNLVNSAVCKMKLITSGHTLYQAAPLETSTSLHCCSTSLLQRFTALVRNSGETQCLEEAEQQQRQVSTFLILLFKLLTQFSFLSFLSSLSSL